MKCAGFQGGEVKSCCVGEWPEMGEGWQGVVRDGGRVASSGQQIGVGVASSGQRVREGFGKRSWGR